MLERILYNKQCNGSTWYFTSVGYKGDSSYNFLLFFVFFCFFFSIHFVPSENGSTLKWKNLLQIILIFIFFYCIKSSAARY